MDYTESKVFNGIKIARDLEGAGMERRLAGAMVNALTETIGYVLVVVRLDMDRLKAELRAEIKQENTEFHAAVRQDNAEFRAEVRQDNAKFRAEVKQDNAAFQSKMQQQMEDFKTEVRGDIADLKLEMQKYFIRTVSAMAALLALYGAIMKFLEG